MKNIYRKRKRIKPNILWGPVPIISIKNNSRCARLYSYRSSTLVYEIYHINKREDFDYVLDNYPKILGVILPYFVFIWTIWNYDIFQFFFDGRYLTSTPLKNIELSLLKALGKKIVVSPYGSDVIMPSKVKNKYKWNVALEIEKNYPNIDEKKIEENIYYFTKYSDFVINDGQAIDFLPKWDLSLKIITIDLEEWKPHFETNNSIIQIVHAPNHRALKGTKYLIKACEELKEEGCNLKLTIVEKMKNEEAKRVYEKADIIADQFLLGWYGLFAIESMALGKSVLCYLRKEWSEYYGRYYKNCPIVSTNPDNLKKNLQTLIENAELRSELGKKGRAYVEKYHSYEYIGGMLDKIYRKIWFGEKIDPTL